MNKIVIFVKAPIPGRVKTRLCPPLSEQQAARLYAAFARDTLDSAESVPGAAVKAAYVPGEKFPSVAWMRDQPPVSHFCQQGRDLGERLAHAFRRAFSDGAKKVVVIGSDAPHLGPELIARAFSLLDHKDVAIGPAEDGGYYLIGLRQAHPELFAGVPWSTGEVFQETIQQANRLGLRSAVLPTFADVDTFADLIRLHRKLQGLPAQACPATRDALRDILEPKDESLAI